MEKGNKVIIDGVELNIAEGEYSYLTQNIDVVRQGVMDPTGIFTVNLHLFCEYLLKQYSDANN